jgi:hypothetical protein
LDLDPPPKPQNIAFNKKCDIVLDLNEILSTYTVTVISVLRENK